MIIKNYTETKKVRGYLDKIYNDEQLALKFGLRLQDVIKEHGITKKGSNTTFWTHNYTLNSEPGVVISMAEHKDDLGERLIRVSLISEDKEVIGRTKKYLDDISNQHLVIGIEYIDLSEVVGSVI